MGFLQEVETRDGLFPELEDALCEAAARGTASAGERSGVDR
jgi:hypothetical protein